MDPGDPSSYRLILGGSGSMFSICVTLEKQTRLQLTWHQWHHQNSPNFFLGTPDRFQLSSKILKPEETTVGKFFLGGLFFPTIIPSSKRWKIVPFNHSTTNTVRTPGWATFTTGLPLRPGSLPGPIFFGCIGARPRWWTSFPPHLLQLPPPGSSLEISR